MSGGGVGWSGKKSLGCYCKALGSGLAPVILWASVLPSVKGIMCTKAQQGSSALKVAGGLGGSPQCGRLKDTTGATGLRDGVQRPCRLRALDQGRPVGLGQAAAGQSASRKCVLNPEVGSSLGLDWKRGQQGPVWYFKCAKRGF